MGKKFYFCIGLITPLVNVFMVEKVVSDETETRVGSTGSIIVDRTFEQNYPDPEVIVTILSDKSIRVFESGLPDDVYIKRARYLASATASNLKPKSLKGG